MTRHHSVARVVPLSRGQGAALVLVLWFVAAMSLLVVSLTGTARVDVKAAGLTVNEVRAMALADAAIMIALLDLESRPEHMQQAMFRQYPFEAHTIRVELRASSGFVNLNLAPEGTLARFLSVVAALPDTQAEQLAAAIVAWRSPSAVDDLARAYQAAGLRQRPRHGRFEAVEDLLQVAGIDLDLYAKIKSFLTVYGQDAGINIRHAPAEVLAVLADGRMDVAQRVAQALRAGEVGVDTTMLDASLSVSGVGEQFRVESSVDLGGWRFTRTRWVERGSGNSAPWLTLQLETRIGPVTDTADAKVDMNF